MNKCFCVVLVISGMYFIHSCDNKSSVGSIKEEMPEVVSYNFDIRPILSDKCFACHGPDKNTQAAGLRLDMAEEAYKALKEHPDAHAIVPGKPEFSELFLRISTSDTSQIMPPVSSNLRLSAHEIRLIEKWIEQGAAYEKHWAFIPPEKQPVPTVTNTAWPRHEIDYFILSKQEKAGVSPNPEADKERLIKRLAIDLNGLPPTIRMMDAFLADERTDAYEQVVDQLLDHPAFGEKMALYWMDVARYADSHGYQYDNYRSQWPWRDWVIHAFNKNMSYKDFITWQLAGDLLPDFTKEQLLATGFNRNHKITEETGVIDEEYRVSYVTDRTDTFGKALLGVTMECAHCHDHKYDPFSQKEYFRLFSFFNNVKEKGIEMKGSLSLKSAAKHPFMEITNEDVKSILHFVNKQDTARLIVGIMGDQDTVRKTYILERGIYDAHGEEVQPGTPAAILPFSDQLPKNRYGLAQWLFDKKHPLTARVFVNQIWQEFFGRGIVKTAGDFGLQGELPSHPELLDWLAVDFMENGWDIKRLIRQLVTSATYRQSAVITPEKLRTDPGNILLSRSPRYRMKAEFIRDVVLSSSGLLVKTIGGPSVKPYQPEGLWEAATAGYGDLAEYKQDHGNSLYRRGLYTFVKRTLPPPSMAVFDASNRDLCEVSRLVTNTPLQALVMLNDPTVSEASRVLAASLWSEDNSVEEKITKAFRLIVCRKPVPREIDVLTQYYESAATSMTKEKAEKLLAIGEYPFPEKADKIKVATAMQVITAIYNLEETITKT